MPNQEIPQYQALREGYQRQTAVKTGLPGMLERRTGLIAELSYTIQSSSDFLVIAKAGRKITAAADSAARIQRITPLVDHRIADLEYGILEDLRDTNQVAPQQLDYWERYYGLTLAHLEAKNKSSERLMPTGIARPRTREQIQHIKERTMTYLGNGIFASLPDLQSQAFKAIKSRGIISRFELAAILQKGQTDEIAQSRAGAAVSGLNSEIEKFGIGAKTVTNRRKGSNDISYGLTGIIPEGETSSRREILRFDDAHIVLPTIVVKVLRAIGSEEQISATKIREQLNINQKYLEKILRIGNSAILQTRHEVKNISDNENPVYRFSEIPEGIELDGVRIAMSAKELGIWNVFKDGMTHKLDEDGFKTLENNDEEAIQTAISRLNTKLEIVKRQLVRETVSGQNPMAYLLVEYDEFKPHDGQRMIEFYGEKLVATAGQRQILFALMEKAYRLDELSDLLGRSTFALNNDIVGARRILAKIGWKIRTTKRKGKSPLYELEQIIA